MATPMDTTVAQLQRAELLHVAIARNSFELVRELLETYNLDPNTKSSKGIPPLHLAAWEGNVALVVCLLVHKAEVGLAEEGTGWTALHLAARRGHEEVFAALVEAGADLHGRDRFGCSVLAYAVLGGSAAIVRFLLQSGLDVDHRRPSTSLLLPSALAAVAPCASALHLASARGDLGLVQLLLDHGAHANLQDDAGRTPLSCAVLHLHRDVAALLLAHERSGVDSADSAGRTALHHAVGLAARATHEEARAAAWDIVELLLYHGADVEAKDQLEATPLDLAADGAVDMQKRLAGLARQHRRRTASSVICLSVIGLATSFVMLSRLRG